MWEGSVPRSKPPHPQEPKTAPTRFKSASHPHKNPRQARVREAEATERSINEARETYRPAATRGSVLFFVIADLAAVNPMYQWSLSYFARLFKSCVSSSARSEDVAERLALLSAFATDFVFRSVSRGLFEEHKGLFAFLLAAAIARHHPGAGEVSEAEWGFFLRGAAAGGGGGGAAAAVRAPRPAWAPEAQWRALCHLEGAAPAAFAGLAESAARGPDTDAWRAWCDGWQ